MQQARPSLRTTSGEDPSQHMPPVFSQGYSGAYPSTTRGIKTGYPLINQQPTTGLGGTAIKLRSGVPDGTYDFPGQATEAQRVPLAYSSHKLAMSPSAFISQNMPLPSVAPLQPHFQPKLDDTQGPASVASVNTPLPASGATGAPVGLTQAASMLGQSRGTPLPAGKFQPPQELSISHLRDTPVPDSISPGAASTTSTASSASRGRSSSNSKSISKVLPDKQFLEQAKPQESAAAMAPGNAPASAAAAAKGAAVAAVSSEMSRMSMASGGSGGASGPSGGAEVLSALLATDEESMGCRRFSFEQLQAATENFSPANFLSKGAFDAVYKGKLMGCKVAVKRLEGGGWQGPIEYRTEVEVLSRMRHPNIVLLMGHCPEEHCLVYEYLSGGSLQDTLDQKKGSRPLRWFERIKVMSQIVDALLFLHHHEPPIVHRDLNPGNILIDRNAVVKLADVGLARLIVDDDAITAGAKGTPGYIDPEEMATLEVSTLGDVYALGLICLQLLTGESKIQRLQRTLVEAGVGTGARALSRAADSIMGYLDRSGGEWPLDLARQLAVMALKCADPRRMRRPDLAEEVQPLLQKALDLAAEEASRALDGLSSQLICPLSKVRMTDPVLAADGFTYERSAMERWLQHRDLSPVTGQPLEHKFLTPNNGLRLVLMQQAP